MIISWRSGYIVTIGFQLQRKSEYQQSGGLSAGAGIGGFGRPSSNRHARHVSVGFCYYRVWLKAESRWLGRWLLSLYIGIYTLNTRSYFFCNKM